MKKNRAILVLGIFFLSTSLFSQITFNNRMDFNRPGSTLLTSVEVTDSCYYVSGLLIDSNPPYKTGNLFAKINLTGDIDWYKELVDISKTYETWPNTLTKINNKNFYATGYSFEDTLMYGLVIKFDDSGDTIRTHRYLSPYAPDNYFMALTTSHLTPNDGLLLSSNIANPQLRTDINLIKTDSTGNIEWSEVYGEDFWTENGASISPSGNGYIIGGWKTNHNFVSINYIMRSYIFEIDSIGNLLWEYLSPEGELQYSATDILKSDDGGLVVISGKGTEHVSGMAAYVSWQNYVFKIDANQEFEWGLDLRSGLPESTNYLHKMLEISNGTGYIIAGHNHEPNYDENGQDNFGTIIKISTSGDSLWTRRYQHLISPQDNHEFNDIEETADGGFIMVGQSTERVAVAPQPHQQSWIVKVDQHGCLVPGCHLIDDVEEPIVDLQLSLYPNPTSDYLNIFYYDPRHAEEVEYQITDIQGRVLRQFKSRQNNVTLMIPLDGLVAGQYFLVVKGGREMVTESFVKL